MKKIVVLVFGLVLFQFVNATPPVRKIALQSPATSTPLLDQCMDEYNTMSVLLESGFSATVQHCYSVYRFPYDLNCHGQAIQIWSFYQDWLFEDLVSCQNGNVAKPTRNTK